MTQETKFLQALKDVFVGATIEGESGYINLMRIKARYFERGVFPRLMQAIDAAVAPFPGFREELFDKLYDFFHRYFSESGSIYFRYTPLHQRVYEKVYSDERDVALFYKTHMLYYVKTDRLFHSMDVVVDGLPFHFDVTGLEHKRANEKRALVFEFRERRSDNVLVLTVGYSENGRKTKTDAMVRAVQRTGVRVDEETLERAFRLFERQSEVDFFINKDARAFLRQQFDLWLYQYVFEPEQRSQTLWSERRIRQVQVLKDTAYRIIDFIAQFEDELVRIWNKPKFVRGSHYIITLERVAAQGEAGQALLARFLAHPNLAAQVEEWRELGMVGEDFDATQVWASDDAGQRLDDRYQFLPLDTRHFPDLERELVALFDHLDDTLDGWLVRSDNYQALISLEPKFRRRVKCIHVDPPYNTATSGFLYANAYQHSSWLAMMQNRIAASLNILTEDGSFLCHIDENEYEHLQLLFDGFSLPSVGTIIWDKRNPMLGRKGVATQHEYVLWRSSQDSPIYRRNDTILAMLRAAEDFVEKHGAGSELAQKAYTVWIDGNKDLSGGEKAYRYLDDQGRVYQSVSLMAPEPRTDSKFFLPLIHPVTGKPCPVPANGFSRTPETLRDMLERDEIIFGTDESVQPRKKVFLTEASKRQIASVVQDSSRGKMDMDKLVLDFPYCHPVSLYETLTGAATESPDDIILDFFAGSGTTAHAVMNLNREDGGQRKYILVEMGEHFETVILPRIKKIAFSDQWRDGQAQPGGRGISHFVKYFSLEQYEDVLRRAVYADTEPLFVQADPFNQYVFLRDLKLLDNAETGEAVMTLDFEQDAVHVHLERLYPDVDVAETLSCVTGQRIRRLTTAAVEFENGERMSLSDPPWEAIKPLIWW